MDKAKFVGGLVKAVFILCYAAFMVASIRHVAVFFNSFEPNGDNIYGSYALAGSFDLTALVVTIGVMFFRRSMPPWVFWVVWAFIAGIALYSYVINLEYASHFQSMDLLMQPTGETTPVLDASGNVHYIPVMRINTELEWINPFLASGFTIFSLIYSVIAEFFGAKAPTAQELMARKKYLEETATVKADIKALEEETKGPSLIQQAKQKAMELREVVGEVTKKDPDAPVDIHLENALTYLRKAPALLQVSEQRQTLGIMVKHLGIPRGNALGILVECRGLIDQENQREMARMQEEMADQKTLLAVEFLGTYGVDSSDENLAEYLDLQRPAAALFYRRKALIILEERARKSQEKLSGNDPGNAGEMTQETGENLLRNDGESGEEMPEKAQRNTGELGEESSENWERIAEESDRDSGENVLLDPATLALLGRYPLAQKLLETSETTVSIADASLIFKCSPNEIILLAEGGTIAFVKGKKSVKIPSLLAWAKREKIGKKVPTLQLGSRQKTGQNTLKKTKVLS